MKKPAALLFLFTFLLFTLCLWAADFWTKPYTDWTDKEIQKMSENSPWAKPFDIALPGGGEGREDGGSTGKGKGSGGYSPMGQTSGRSQVTGQDTAGGGMTLRIRWQSALPVKQAFVRSKYGAEAATSPDAKQILSTEDPVYVVVVEGLSRRTLGGGEDDALKQAMMEQTALVIKGREPIKPVDFRVVGQGRISAVFAFPKTTPITIDDKDVEFQSKLGTLVVKQKFHLKDMTYNGKLEL